MAFSPQFLDNIKDRVSLAEVVGKKIKLVRKGNEYWGNCPFHHEKTASFSVVEDKGFYHCFGCGAHGSVIDFEMKINNLTFPEAIEKLANLAGLELPVYTKEDFEKHQKQIDIYEVLEQACLFYEKQLHMSPDHPALLYLKNRGLSDEIIKRFRIGYAPSNNALKAYFKALNISDELLKSSGIISFPEDGRSPYDYFRDRVLFPILDKRGRVIAFGGRILGQGEPKYLNSPETDSFSKRDTLFGLSFATADARDLKKVILVEGYMDTIALHAVGITHTVAPLGTALTERQIQELWRLAPEPTLCFDGDTAGQRAALRAAERVLPLLKPGFSLQFITLPDNLDPDDFILEKGKDAFLDFLNQKSVPLFKVLWSSLIKDKKLETPERKASLEKDIRETLAKISDTSVQNFYAQEFKSALWEATRSKTYQKKPSKKYAFKNQPELLSVYHPKITPKNEESRMMTAYLYLFPEIASEYLEQFSDWQIEDPALAKLFSFVLSGIAEDPDINTETLKRYLKVNEAPDVEEFLSKELEMLSRKEISIHDVKHTVKERLAKTIRDSLDKQMEQLRQEMKNATSDTFDELWRKHEALRLERLKIE